MSILTDVWGEQTGYVFVPVCRKGTKDVWNEGKAYKYPEESKEISERIKQCVKDGWDTYWCPLVFSEPKRIKENAMPLTGILWADLDFVDPMTIGSLKPSIAWKSSDERYQALWWLDTAVDTSEAESLNRALTYKIGADKGGWDVTQVLRIPGSPNFKYDPPQKGKVLWNEKVIFSYDKLCEALLETEKMSTEATETPLESILDVWDIPQRTKDLLLVNPKEVEVGDRSDRLWEIETSLLECGLPIKTVVQIILRCPWNKFKGRKNEVAQINAEILKADEHVKLKGVTPVLTEVEIREKEEKERTKWAIPFEAFTATKLPKPQWLVEGIWQEGTYGMIAGEPKTYKSVQATDLALSVASGKPFLNYFKVNKSGTVLFIQEENNEQTVQDRVFKIASEKGLIQATSSGLQLIDNLPIYFSNNYGIDLTKEDSRTLIENTIEKLEPILVVLDPLYMMLGTTDENNASEVGVVLRWLTSLRNKYNTSILICHHYNKSSSGSRGGQRVRGSSAFHAWVESAIYVKTTDELYTVDLEREFRAFPTMQEVRVKLELGNPGELGYKPIVLKEFDSKTKTFSTSTPKEDEIVEMVLGILSVAPRTLNEIMSTTKLTQRQCTAVIIKLIRGGVIAQVGTDRGLNASYILK